MKKLNQDQIATQAQIAQEIRALANAFEQAVYALDSHIEEASAEIERLQDEYNGAVQRANEFRAEVVEEMDAHLEGLTERQRDSAAGEAYLEWASVWSTDLDEVELVLPESIYMPELWAWEMLDELPVRPSAK